MDIRSVDRKHVPELEQEAFNQMPKSSDHRDVKLYQYEASNMYQWYSKRNLSVFEDPCGEPFVIE